MLVGANLARVVVRQEATGKNSLGPGLDGAHVRFNRLCLRALDTHRRGPRRSSRNGFLSRLLGSSIRTDLGYSPLMSGTDYWKQCNICKKPIAFEADHFLCSVSTCRRKRTGLVFCELACFEAHLPMLRHRDAWAEKEKAPSKAAWQAEKAAAVKKQAESPRRVIASPSETTNAAPPNEVLVIASKLKKFIKLKANMNTSDSAISVISDHLRELSVAALRNAAADGRKTVLDRDFKAVIQARRDP